MTSDAKSVTLLRLADGTLIDPLTRVPLHMGTEEGGGVEESASPATIADTITPTVRRSLHDLKLSKHQMAIINNVLVYSLWGLPDDEIAIQCSCSLSDVYSVRELGEYGYMHDALIAGLRVNYMASAHGIISNAAEHAAKVVVAAAKKSSGRMQFDAARDILDRSGHRPVDHASVQVNINDAGDDLVIRVVRESEKPRIPTIDMSPKQNGA